VPTYSDTGPTVIKEARVVGLPIITTTAAGASSYVTDSGCGYVTASGDLDALAKTLLDVCSTREHTIALGSKSLSEHRDTFHPRNTASKFVDLYQRVGTHGFACP
jgi:glycosyltransferase involved in cell wall biosynthesis